MKGDNYDFKVTFWVDVHVPCIQCIVRLASIMKLIATVSVKHSVYFQRKQITILRSVLAKLGSNLKALVFIKLNHSG